jgi:phage terminase small subunit
LASPDWVKRQRFAKEFAVSGNATAAAKVAGVPATSAHSMGYRWSKDPAVQALIRKEMNASVVELGPYAIVALRTLLTSDQTPASVRLAAARDVLDRAREVAQEDRGMELHAKRIHDMSLEELESLLATEMMLTNTRNSSTGE